MNSQPLPLPRSALRRSKRQRVEDAADAAVEEIVVDGAFEAVEFTPLNTPRHSPLSVSFPPPPFEPPVDILGRDEEERDEAGKRDPHD